MLEKLSLKEKFWPILALDHGLTVGHNDSVSIAEIPSLLVQCEQYISSVVMTYGLARLVKRNDNLPLIVQCFGAPLGNPKVQVCSIYAALSLKPKGISVQVDFSLSGKSLGFQLASVSTLVGQAHKEKLPVLFMIAPHENKDLDELLRSIRFCIELGADLIKTRFNILSLDKEEQKNFISLLRETPPVLLAGGASNKDVLKEVSKANKLGFSGYCIGRSIFQSPNPVAMSHNLYEAWHGKKPELEVK